MKNFYIIGLLIAGLAGWVVLFGVPSQALITLGNLGPWFLLTYLLMVLAVAWTPPIASPIFRLLQRVSQPQSGGRIFTSVVVAVLTWIYLFVTARLQHRQFFPYVHDEFSYLIQAHQFARDRLWMPGHPMAPFFESFQLFARPVYASAYFPGTAILYIPGVLLHAQPFLTSLTIAAVVAGLLFWIAGELLDGVAAWLAWLLLLSDGIYRQLSIMTLGQLPLLFYVLMAVVAWLQWRRTKRTEWAVGIGFFLALAAVTRPVDALCFGIPIGFAVVIRSRKKKLTSAVAGLIGGTVPLLVLQLLLNHGITGSWLQTPFDRYADQEYPGSRYGYHPLAATAHPQSELPQIRKLFSRYKLLIQRHQLRNALTDLKETQVRGFASQASPATFTVLVVLLPLSLIGFGLLYRFQRASIGALLATLPLLAGLYVPYVFFYPHYALVAAPGLILGILLGARVLTTAWPDYRRFATVAVTLFIGGISIAALPNWWGWNDDMFRADLLADVNSQLARIKHQPAVVLFTYDPNRNVDEEPVYNADVARVNDAPVIRAHDRGLMNRQLYQYYADVQPDRFFYRYDERDRSLHELGNASALVANPR